MRAGERQKALQATANPSREEIESIPVGGPGSAGEGSRQRANTYLNAEREMLRVLRAAIRRMEQTGRDVDPALLNAYARIKAERTERETNYGVGLDGPTQRAERWLNALDAAGKIPAVYSAEWADLTRAKNKTFEEQNETMFLEDDLRGKKAKSPFAGTTDAASYGKGGTQTWPEEGLPEVSNAPTAAPQGPVVEMEDEDPEKKNVSLRAPFNSLFAVNYG